MNKKCVFCGEPVPINRRSYCSVKCIKRAYYIRKNPNCKSYLTHNPDFWKTNTGVGFYWEQYVAKKLKAKHIEFNKMGADLLWGNKYVDVKSSNLFKRKNRRGKVVGTKNAGNWVFNRGKEKKEVDYYYCICLIGGKPVKELLIPSSEFKSCGITVGLKSQYDRFIV